MARRTATVPALNQRIDAYIESQAQFAQPILRRLRELVHEGCPDVQETIKWGSPTFEYKGILCGMAAFKGHCAFGFWKHKLLVTETASGEASLGKIAAAANEKAMGQFGRLTSVADLPPRKTMLSLIRQAVALNESGAKVPRTAKPKSKLVVPKNLAAALRGNPDAARAFKAFSYSKQKDYIDWLEEAKTDATRQRRLETAIEWISQGKSRNWKYERC